MPVVNPNNQPPAKDRGHSLHRPWSETPPSPRREAFRPALPRVSVVVPVHLGGAKFRRCLDALGACVPEPYEVLIVGDGEDDGSLAVAADAGATVLQTPCRSGPSAARNLGARRATGDVLFFVDADVAVDAACIRQIERQFSKVDATDAVIGSYDDQPSERNLLSQYANLRHHYVHQNALEDANTFWGACGAVRRDVFLNAGGFDEGYARPCIEDIELGYRLTAAGHRIRLDKGLLVKHLKRWTPAKLLRTDLFHRAIPWTRLILGRHVQVNDLNVQRKSKLSVALAWLLPVIAVASIRQPWLLLAVGGIAAALIALDLPLLRFFAAKRGFAFAAGCAAWHGFYHWYCGAGWLIGAAAHHLGLSWGARSRIACVAGPSEGGLGCDAIAPMEKSAGSLVTDSNGRATELATGLVEKSG